MNDEILPISDSAPWQWPDKKLLADCRWEAYRGSGPGGQKRNKTSSAVRITHLPTGIHAIAEESRSQSENRLHALRRLRHKLAMEIRHEFDLLASPLPDWLEPYRLAGLHMAEHNPLYPSLVALILDILRSAHWELSRAAVTLGVTNSALARFMHADGHLWERVNRIRKELGMRPLLWQR